LYGHGASAAADCAPTRPGLEEAGADTVWEIGQIDEGEEVDGLEFAVDGGRAADAAGDFEVGTEEPGRAQASRDGNAGGMAGVAGLRKSAQGRMDEVPVHEGPVHGHAVVFILGGDGAAADEVAGVVAGGVDGDAFPEGVEDHDVAVVDVNAGAAEFEEFAADRFVDGEVEDLIAVVTKIAAGDVTGLQAIGADEFARLDVTNHEVIAEGIERVDIEAGALAGGETFAEFEIKDVEAEALAFDQVFRRSRETDAEEGSFG
jgi:hypothetical protein